MRKLTLATGSFLILAAPLAQADILGLGASVSYWDSDLSGNVAKDNHTVDVDDEPRLDNDGNANAGLYLEHPVPLLPNVALSYTKIQQSGRGQLSHEYDKVERGSVYSELDLEQLDL